MHDLIEGATRGLTDMLAGISGFDLSDTELEESKLNETFNISSHSVSFKKLDYS